MDVMDAILGRYSLRSFAPREVEEEKLQKILDAGRLAPTASNQQRVKVVVVKDPQVRSQLAQACRGQTFIGEAPVVLVVCADQERTMLCGQSARGTDCTISLAFMCLEAAEQGIFGCWIGAFYQDQVKALLGIPEDYLVAGVFPMGYPKGDPVRREKKPLTEFFSVDAFQP